MRTIPEQKEREKEGGTGYGLQEIGTGCAQTDRRKRESDLSRSLRYPSAACDRRQLKMQQRSAG